MSSFPLGPDAPKEDRIGTAVLAMASGASAEVTWFAVLTSIQLRLLQHSTATSVTQIDPNSFDANFMSYGALCGLAFGWVVAWRQMMAIPSAYRRGALAMVAAFAGAVLGGLLTFLARMIAGTALLLTLAVLSMALAVVLGRRAAQAP